MQVQLEIKEDLSKEEVEELVALAHLLEKDIVFRRDHNAAIKCYELAAKYNNAEAFNRLGWLNGCGIGVKRDIERAVGYFKKAIELNHPIAMVNLGKFYEQGMINNEPDFAIACKYYKMSADLGEPKGLFNYANCLYSGLGIPKDKKGAFAIYKKLAEKDFAEAYVSLGLYYENGDLGEIDITKAIECYEKAAVRGERNAIEALQRLKADNN